MRRFLIALVVAAVAASFVGPASAALIGDQANATGLYKFSVESGWNRGTNGGPFKMTEQTDATNFASFCVEENEYLNWTDTFVVYGTGKGSDIASALNGYIRVSDKTNRALSDYGAWIYWQFRHVNSIYTAATTNAAYSRAVQHAIWYEMKGTPLQSGTEGPAPDTTDDANLTALGLSTTAFSNWWTANGDVNAAAILAQVVVLNINNAHNLNDPNDDTPGQDQLGIILNPGAPEPVPEPASMLVWSLLGGAALGIARMRRRG